MLVRQHIDRTGVASAVVGLVTAHAGGIAVFTGGPDGEGCLR